MKTIRDCDFTTVLNERKHLKMVIRSVNDTFSLFFRANRMIGPDSFTPCTITFVKVAHDLFEMLAAPTASKYWTLKVWVRSDCEQ